MNIKCPHCLTEQSFVRKCTNCGNIMFFIESAYSPSMAHGRRSFKVKAEDYFFSSLGVLFFSALGVGVIIKIISWFFDIPKDINNYLGLLYLVLIVVSVALFVLMIYEKNRYRTAFNIVCDLFGTALAKELYERIEASLRVDGRWYILKHLEESRYSAFLRQEIIFDLMKSNVDFKKEQDIMRMFSYADLMSFKEPIIVPKSAEYSEILPVLVKGISFITPNQISYMLFNTIFRREIKNMVIEISETGSGLIKSDHERYANVLALDISRR